MDNKHRHQNCSARHLPESIHEIYVIVFMNKWKFHVDAKWEEAFVMF
jgi:hypothetical protein